MAITEGTLMWTPSEEFKNSSNLTLFMNWLRTERKLDFKTYDELWRWSVAELESFWQAMWDYFEIFSLTPYESVLINKMPEARWFEGASVNYTEHILRMRKTGEVALRHQSEIRPLGEMTWDELTNQVLILATHLRKLGVQSGDRVAAFLPNITEAAVAMLATISIGAVWSSCSPDFGSKSVLDRFQQIEPKVLFVIDGYKFGGKDFDRSNEVRELKAGLPTVENVIFVPYLHGNSPIDEAILWTDIMSQPIIAWDDFTFEKVPFNHPIWILYSSGTTGTPKGIVHSHGGVLLEMYKLLDLHMNLSEGKQLFFYTSTAWMLYNVVISSLLTGATAMLYDGNPAYPTPGFLWEIAEKSDSTMLGASPTYINLMKKAGVVPMEQYDLSKIDSLILSGSPAGPEVFEWVYEYVKKDIWLSPISGGTDIVSAFVGSVPTEPVYASEMQARLLGADVQAYDEAGKSLIDEVGELVIQQPMPSMPIYFWNDLDGKRYFESYFDTYENIWRHGDYLKITSRGTCLIYGRSDSTLNRNGVRIGTSEIYSAVETIEQVQDSLIVNVDLDKGQFFMPLFVLLEEGCALTDELKKQIRDKIRIDCSPRHLPDEIYAVPLIPYTLTGKKMEIPIRKILMGVPVEKAANIGIMKEPQALDFFIQLAKEKRFL